MPQNQASPCKQVCQQSIGMASLPHLHSAQLHVVDKSFGIHRAATGGKKNLSTENTDDSTVH